MALTPEQTSILTKLTAKLFELGLEAKPLPEVSVGPVITAYRFMPQGRTKVSQLEGLADDFAVALGAGGEAADVMVKRMPGESAVSVFVPNQVRTFVQWRDTVGAASLSPLKIPISFGVDWMGRPFIEDLTTLPHLLIAGSTGSGKSVFLKSAILATTIYSRNSNAVKLALADPTGVELTAFAEAPHLIAPIATTKLGIWQLMDDTITEMEDRLQRLARAHVVNCDEYNQRDPVQPMPRIILVIDELAEILISTKRGEGSAGESRLAKIVAGARKTGIHVIAATQRPSVDVVTGLVKANFPARLTFRLPDRGSSMTILGTTGAERLLARGDMLYQSPNCAGLQRLHAPIASREDIEGALRATMFKYQLEK